MKPIPFFVVFLLFSFTQLTFAEDFVALFPFAISHDAPKNIVNVATWNDSGETERHVPAGKFGIIRIENGRFVHDKGRFLIWGTNFCSTANCPEKAEAEQVAARLARFGVNCVRIHHLDNSEIWGGSSAKTKLTIDPDKLDKLDYLIYQLKLNGIYTNINLHVSRTLDERDGFTGSSERPKFDKGLDNFYRPFIEAQKKYARDLLTHVNPYTKTAYVNEPGVSMVEINNENSCVAQWAWGNTLMQMPDPYLTDFRKQWNEFLRKKYKSTAKLSEAWKCISEPPGEEMLKQKLETQKWNVEVDADTKCKKIQSGDVMRLEVEKMGNVNWHPQLIA
ncbi:MAG: cellulase family glycosylhydrolase, partial [Planctomycetaceae bacterium]|nr:cellulase family glycosylhydrolase [Planctomycetaceae bacterium]